MFELLAEIVEDHVAEGTFGLCLVSHIFHIMHDIRRHRLAYVHYRLLFELSGLKFVTCFDTFKDFDVVGALSFNFICDQIQRSINFQSLRPILIPVNLIKMLLKLLQKQEILCAHLPLVIRVFHGILTHVFVIDSLHM